MEGHWCWSIINGWGLIRHGYTLMVPITGHRLINYTQIWMSNTGELKPTHGSTHCGPVMPYGDRDLGQHWLRWWLVAWRHQAITWTNVDWSSVKSSDIHIRAISQEMPQSSITKICLKITNLKFHWNFPGANELTHCGPVPLVTRNFYILTSVSFYCLMF